MSSPSHGPATEEPLEARYRRLERDYQELVREHAETVALLRDSERQFHDFAETIPQLAWIARGDGFIFWYNRRWYEYTGTTPAQMEGWGWQSVHDPAELPQVLERWQKSIESGAPFDMTFPLKGADGRFRWFLTRVMPVRDHHGAIARWFGTNTDVDEQRKALRERDLALREAEQAISARDEFLSIASHELKTPLAALLLQVQGAHKLAESRGPLQRIAERLQKASSAGTKLERLMVDLLDVSRLSVGALRLVPQPLDLVLLVREICERLDARRPPSISIAAEGPVVGSWDPLRLEQVMTNLLENALKYGREQPIEVSVTRRDSAALVSVTDHGIGIPASEQPHLFKRFSRAKGVRDYRGFGLGLWIAREIVEASGGRIEVLSAEGSGSTFTVTLPIGGDDAGEGPHPHRG